MKKTKNKMKFGKKQHLFRKQTQSKRKHNSRLVNIAHAR